MTPEVWLLLILLIGIVYVCFTERLPLDLAALLVLAIITGLHLIAPAEAFAGFSSPPVITMIGTFFITAAFRKTGITDQIGAFLFRIAGTKEFMNVLVVVGSAAFISTFMNKLAAAALLLPAVMSLSSKSSVPPSRLLIPLSFGTILGGTTTIFGTTANLLAVNVMERLGEAPLRFFDFTVPGIFIVITGGLFLAFWGRKMLPTQDMSQSELRDRDLPQLYRLHERLFTVKVPLHSRLGGKTLAEVRFGEELGASVDALIRAGERREPVEPHDALRAGDSLIVRGRSNDFSAIKKLAGIVQEEPNSSIFTSGNLVHAMMSFADTATVKTTLRELHQQLDADFVCVEIERKGKRTHSNLGTMEITGADHLYIIATKDEISKLAAHEKVKVTVSSLSVTDELKDKLLLLRVPQGSQLHGVPIKESELGRLARLLVIAIVRGGDVLTAKLSSLAIQEGDGLVVVGGRLHLQRLLDLSDLEVQEESLQPEYLLSKTGTFEVVLSPRSTLIGKTLDEVDFRERYQCRVLAIWREGKPTRTRLAQVPLRFGDALLLQGGAKRLDILSRDPDFVVLSENHGPPARRDKAPIAIGGLLLLIVLSITRWVPIEVAALFAGLFVVLFGAVRMSEVYREIEWRIIVWIGAVLPLGLAVERSGLLDPVASILRQSNSPLSVTLAVLGFCILSSLIGQLLDSTLSVVLLLPLAVEFAHRTGMSVPGLVMAITLSSSILFMTPFSHRANLFVMSPGGYKARDFVGIGSLLSLVMLATILTYVYLTYAM